MPAEKVGRFQFSGPVPVTNVNIVEARRFKGKDGKESGEPKFGIVAILEPDNEDLAKAKAVAMEVAKAAFPGIPLKSIRFPFKNGDKENERRGKRKDAKTGDPLKPLDWQTGKVVLGAHTTKPPSAAILVNGVPMDLETPDAVKAASRHFYNGVEALLGVSFVAYGDAAALEEDADPALVKPGVTSYLNLILSTGRASASAAAVLPRRRSPAMPAGCRAWTRLPRPRMTKSLSDLAGVPRVRQKGWPLVAATRRNATRLNQGPIFSCT